jgi:hypothetical protein
MRTATLLLVPLAAAGCGLNLRLVDASVKKPSNVAVYFSVTDGKKQPVPNLVAENFKIYEDGGVISPFESKQTILNPEVAAIQYTLLLMDMSGSVTASGQLPPLIDAAGSFGERVGQTQQVAVYAFDGQKEIHPIVGFSTGAGSVRSGIAALNDFHSRDPSTNLNGAVIEAIHALQKQMERSPQPLRFGTLVVFTDGSDRAHRVTRDALMQELDKMEGYINIFVIGVGAEIDESELSAIGRAGSVLSKKPEEVKTAFDKIAATVEGFTKSFYLLSYCSPSRAGEHDVRIEANVKDSGSGGLVYHFNAEGFGPNCDPKTKPSFDVRHPKLDKKTD